MLERLEQLRVRIVFAASVPRTLCVPHEAPEDDRTKLSLPDLGMLGSEPARLFEQLAGAVEILRRLRGGGLALRHEGEPEPRVRVVAGRSEELIGSSHVAALQRGETRLLLLRRLALRDHVQAALGLGILRVAAEDTLGLCGIAAIEGDESRLQRRGMPGAVEASCDLRVGGMSTLVGPQERNRGVVGCKPEERSAPGARRVLSH